MSYIRNRKHTAVRQPLLTQSLLALAALSAPMAAHAQSAVEKKDAKLPEVSVTATADAPYKADKVSSPKLTQPLVDTTQTITVIRKEVLQEQAASSIAEALRNTPGITFQLGENGNTSAGDTFQMRGFSTQSSIFVDGIRDLGAISRDVFNIEQIEVSKGPAGTDVGRGAASGYINLASKLPTLENAVSGTAGFNTGDNKRVTADLNRKIGDSVAIRLNVMGQDGGIMGRKVIDKTQHGIAPSVAFGLGTPTRVFIYSQHVRQHGVPDGGLPAVGLQGFYNANRDVAKAPRVDRENFYGYASDYEKTSADMATVKVEHQFDATTTITNTSRYGKSSMDRILTGVNALTAPAGTAPSSWLIGRTRQSVLQDNQILANSTNVVSEFATGSVGHTVSAGLEFLREEQFNPTRTGLGSVSTTNLYQPNRADLLLAYKPVLTGAFTKGATTTAAAYLFDTIKLSPAWQLNGGLRYEHYSTSTDAATATTTATPAVPVIGTLIGSHIGKSDKLLSWKAGALYKPADNGSVYLSYATSQTPPGGAAFALSAAASSVNGPAMDPQKTSNVELGTKWDVVEKKLALTAALYRTENKNEFTLQDPVALTYSQLGKRRVQGVELGAVGQITRDWNIIAGVATMKATILEGTTGGSAAGAGTRWSPDLTATLWSSYKISDAFSVGGGLRYTSEQKRVIDPKLDLATQNTPGIPSYAVADALLSYKANKHLTVQLNVYNLFDKFYVNTLNNGGSRATLGVERSAQLTANFAF